MAGTITHQWNGTILTITSDSGTSSCDLKGAKGDDGARGAQGAPGSSVAEDSQMLGGVAAAQYALKNNVPAHNLLDNSDFSNPVNQRGASSWASSGYSIDRWRADGDGSATLSSSGITVSDKSFRQYVKLPAGTYTLAFKISNGVLLTISFTYDGTSTLSTIIGNNASTTGAYINYYNYSSGVVACQFVLGSDYTYTLTWAALYEGAYDASTLPAYQPKGLAAELVECQRYYREVYRVFGKDIGNVMREAIILNPQMRIPPTATVKSLWKGDDGTSATVGSIANDNVDITYTGWGNVRLSLSADL